MKRLLLIIILLLVAVTLYATNKNPKTFVNNTKMQITSSAFRNNTSIPIQYTCDGENINPPLAFLAVPPGTKSLVLLMDDPDIPDTVKESRGIEKFDHWTIFNMPSDTAGIAENSMPPGVEGRNSTGESNYRGPCPPDGQHRYFFKLFALDIELSLDANATQNRIMETIQSHVLETAEIIGLYKRQ